MQDLSGLVFIQLNIQTVEIYTFKLDEVHKKFINVKVHEETLTGASKSLTHCTYPW